MASVGGVLQQKFGLEPSSILSAATIVHRLCTSMDILPVPPSEKQGVPRWLGRYLPEERAGLHTFLLGTHPKCWNSLIRLLPVEMIMEIFTFFFRSRLFRVTGLTTPWNGDFPWTDNSWCMEVAQDPYSGALTGEGTNLGMTVIKQYSGTLIRNTVDCQVVFPSTGQKSSYKGSIVDGRIHLKIEIVDPGKTSGVKGDYKYATGGWVELFQDDFPKIKEEDIPKEDDQNSEDVMDEDPPELGAHPFDDLHDTDDEMEEEIQVR